jgi:hypothetical protein
LPSLKEFEVLAREALGTDDGVAESAASAEPAQTDEVAASNNDTAADSAAPPEIETEKSESEIAAAESSPVESGGAETSQEAKSETNADVTEAAEKAVGGGAN